MTRSDKKHTAISKLILTAAATGIGISAVPYAQADDSAATTVRKLIIKNPITDETQPVPNPDNPDDVYDVFIGYDGDGTLITNIAPGQVGPGSTDAVSGSSLYSYLKNEFFSSILTEKLDESGSDVNIEYSNNQLTLTLSENGKEKINKMFSSGGKGEKEVHERISSIEQKVDKLDKSMNGGIAKAGAVALLPQPTYAGHSMVSASTAHYNGEQALAIGYSSLSDNGKVILKAGASFNFSGNNTKKPLFGAAVGYQW